jgi:hypothetical protein
MRNENFEFLREFEFKCKKALALLSGALGGCFKEKKEDKNLVPLSQILHT